MVSLKAISIGAFFVFTVCFSSHGNAQHTQADSSLGFIPAILTLLEEDRTIPMTVGVPVTRTVDAERFADGVALSINRIYEDAVLTLSLDGKSDDEHFDVFINGEFATSLSNGVNHIALSQNRLETTEVEIRIRGTATSNWRFNQIIALISDPLRGPRSRAEAQRFLVRATYGPTLSELKYLMNVGYERWLDEQIATPMTNTLAFNDQAIIDRLANRRLRLIEEGETDPNVLNNPFLGRSQETVSRLDSWFHAAINGRDQLRQRVAFALSQIVVVGDTRGDSGNRNRAYSHYHDVLARNALGNYRTLLREVTTNPAMSQWLGFRGNKRTGRPESPQLQPDENYAREIQQLFSIGLVHLNMDGTVKLVDGQPIETYTPEIISAFARVFTGWMWVQSPAGGPINGWETVPLTPWGGEPNGFHDYGEKTLLNYPGANAVNEAGLSTEQDLNRAIDNIFNHPNVAPFISKQLIQRLVKSNPSPQYVERVAQVFQNTNGVKGNLSAVIKAILLDPEAINSHVGELGGKVKEPLLKMTQLWRTFNAKSVGRYVRFSLPERSTGQRPIGAETVFNFYPPDYSPKGELADRNLVAPEFFLLSDGLIVANLNKLGSLATAKDTGNVHPLYAGNFEIPMLLNLEEAKKLAGNRSALLDLFDERLFGGLMSTGLRNVLLNYLADLPTTGSDDEYRQRVVEEALILILASPEYSVQR